MTDPRVLGTLMNIERDIERGAKALVKIATLLEMMIIKKGSEADARPDP